MKFVNKCEKTKILFHAKNVEISMKFDGFHILTPPTNATSVN